MSTNYLVGNVYEENGMEFLVTQIQISVSIDGVPQTVVKAVDLRSGLEFTEDERGFRRYGYLYGRHEYGYTRPEFALGNQVVPNEEPRPDWKREGF